MSEQVVDGQVLDGQVEIGDRLVTEPPPERIDPSELAYFEKVANGLERARELEIQAEECHKQAVALRGAHNSWVSHLIERYRLDPDRDQINPRDGLIMRGAIHTAGS